MPAHKDQTRMPKVRSRPGQNNETLSQKKITKVTLVGFVKLVDKHIKTGKKEKEIQLCNLKLMV